MDKEPHLGLITGDQIERAVAHLVLVTPDGAIVDREQDGWMQEQDASGQTFVQGFSMNDFRQEINP